MIFFFFVFSQLVGLAKMRYPLFICIGHWRIIFFLCSAPIRRPSNSSETWIPWLNNRRTIEDAFVSANVIYIHLPIYIFNIIWNAYNDNSNMVYLLQLYLPSSCTAIYIMASSSFCRSAAIMLYFYFFFFHRKRIYIQTAIGYGFLWYSRCSFDFVIIKHRQYN